MDSENQILLLTLTTIMLILVVTATSIAFAFKIIQLEDNIDRLYNNSVVLKNDTDRVTRNYDNFNEELSVIIPALLRSHNLLTEASIMNDSEVVNTSRMFDRAMGEFNDTDVLNSFDDCIQSTKNRLIINYVMFDASLITLHTREVKGIEYAVYDKDIGYKHTQSIYVTRDFFRYEVFDCGSATYITSENKLDIVLNTEAFEDESVNETVNETVGAML